MDPGLVSSLSGALAQSQRVDKIANNLANADTPGYKADDLIFEESLEGANRIDLRSDVPEEPFKESDLLSRAGDERRVVLYGQEFTDLRAGAVKQTSNPLDLAIEGNGFLEVLTPSGVRLTRAGNLALDASGRLVTKDGFLVLGAGAPGQDPAQRALQVGSGRINIDLEGNIYAPPEKGGALVGKLSVVQVENPDALKKVGGNMFEASPEAFVRAPAAAVAAANRGPASLDIMNLQAPGQSALAKENPAGSTQIRPKVHQGMLESSNVNAVGEMTRLIEAHRMFDENTKLIQTIGDMNSRASELGKF
jgi:flagellar basal-body rod protein FlgG